MPGGPHLLLTKEIINQLYDLISKGSYLKIAIESLGYGTSTLYEWIKKGDEAKDKNEEELNEKDKLYIELTDTIKKAKAEARIRNIKIIQKAAITSWQAAAWYLERTDYEHFGRKDNVDITSKGEKLPVNIIINPIDANEQ